jgi:hypothetical protein
MRPLDGLITRQQAAEILGVTLRHMHNLVRQGKILPADTGSPDTDVFREEEVYALAQSRTKQLDVADAANLAIQAHATARAAQQRLDKLCHLLGFGVNRLNYEDEAVHALYVKVRDTRVSELAAMQTGAIMDWAATFHGIDESYLRIVENYTLDDAPWSSYLELANEIMRYSPLADEVNTRFAFACLDSARKHLRHVAYFYVRTKLGAETADVIFTEGVDDEIIGQLYPMQIGPT